ncbi:MAG: molecular chaperone DnaJ [Chitinivibrionales bacterium]|nr:molecular chaperone DnaJ [Chitinivibrionales bacterium]
MATKRDYYEILGLKKDATEADIKKAYRKLAMQYHPDKNPGNKEAEKMFMEATEAYEILKDEQKRARYDQFGHSAFESGGGGGFSGFDFGGFDLSDALRAFMGDFGGDSAFGDLFGFGGSRRKGRSRSGGMRGNDLQVRLKLTLEEINSGVTKKIKVKRKEACVECKGSGSRGGGKSSCAQCSGSGRIRQVSSSLFGQIVRESVCPICHGEGSIVKDPCHACEGSGRVSAETMVSVDIPAGVAEGNYLTVPEKGDVGPNGGPAGDMLVFIQEEKHEIFERHGIDIFCSLEITFAEAALGVEKIIPTLDGKVSLKIPAGTQSEKIFRLREKGLPALQSSQRGDLLAKVHVATPQKISREMREIFEKLAEFEKKPKNIFEKTRDIFS